MTFDKWTDQEDGEDLVDTCAFLHTKTGEWKKGNCEISSVEGTLCKAASKYDWRLFPIPSGVGKVGLVLK